MTNKPSPSDAKMYATEAPLTTAVKSWLELQLDVAFYKASDRYQAGVSDFILCVGGIFVAIELKAEYNGPSAQQRLFIRQITKANGIAAVCYTLGQVKECVEQARKMAERLG